jgi:hypothetical protein
VGFVVEKVALGEIILQVPWLVLLLSFCQCSTFIHLSPTLILKTKKKKKKKKKTLMVIMHGMLQ